MSLLSTFINKSKNLIFWHCYAFHQCERTNVKYISKQTQTQTNAPTYIGKIGISNHVKIKLKSKSMDFVDV